MKITTNSAEETIKLGRKIGAQLNPGDVVTLEGDLGSGKTTFTKGIAQGIGVEKTITSPTFTLIQIYPQKNKPLRFAHIDTYRAETTQELIGAGITDVLYNKNTISVVEWPNKISSLLKKTIKIKLTSENEKRIIEIPDTFDLNKKTIKSIPIVYWLFTIIIISFYILLFQATN